jgi:integrase/recombinase XerD
VAKKKLRAHVGDRADPDSLSNVVTAYLADLELRNYSRETVRTRRHNLDWFLTWAAERSIERASEVTRSMLQSYQQWLFLYRKKNDEPLTFDTQSDRLISMRLLFAWLTKRNLLQANPAADLELPRAPTRLPRCVLTAEEVDLIMARPDVSTPLGVRDRAILEVLYSTGMRRSELVRLELFDLDLERGTVMIREGKGKKDRVVPIGERACAWTRKYLDDVRPSLVSPEERTVFVSYDGTRFSPDFLSRMETGYIDEAEIGKRGSCHLLRHAMATLMLEGGADIRYVQQMLGHASLETTEIYTHVTITRLKQIHALTHPSAKLAPARSESMDR